MSHERALRQPGLEGTDNTAGNLLILGMKQEAEGPVKDPGSVQRGKGTSRSSGSLMGMEGQE